MDNLNFLITYDLNNRDYLLYTNVPDRCKVELSSIGTRVVPAVEIEEGAETEERYVRNLATGREYTEAFTLSSDDYEEDGSDNKIFTFITSHCVIVENLETSYAISIGEDIFTYQFEIDPSKQTEETIEHNETVVSLIVTGDVTSDITVQYSYYECIALIKDQTYTVVFDDDASTTFEETCGEKNGITYVGDYNTFMEYDESSTDSPSAYEITEGSDNRWFTVIDASVQGSTEDKSYKYDVVFGKEEEAYTEGTYYGQIFIENKFDPETGEFYEVSYSYIGNLNIYSGTAADTGEEFLILSDEKENRLYVREPGTYVLSIQFENLLQVPELVGAALLSMGRSDNLDNYGIGINSSDDYLALPARAISLFETTITPDASVKVSYNYRGILGTLPPLRFEGNNPQVAALYENNMRATQGIYTDNMYIGDANQYIAFYTDKEDKQKHLKISARDIVYEIKDGQEISWNEHIGDIADEEIGKEFDNRLKYFWQNLEHQAGYPAGTYMAGGREKEQPPVIFDKTKVNTYGYNTFMDNTSLNFRYNDEVLTKIGKDGIILGDQNALHLQITSDKIAFLNGQDSDPVSYIESNKLYIPYSVVLNEMQMGEEITKDPVTGEDIKTPLWAWKTMPDNHLRLVWLGKETEENDG